MTAAVVWPSALGLTFLVGGVMNYRRDALGPCAQLRVELIGFAPVFVAAALAAFAGEHFTSARTLAQLVPQWMAGKLLIVYVVGLAQLAAALSLVSKRFIRWSSISLALMFSLFVLLLWIPSVVIHPAIRNTWIVAVRDFTFAVGGFALFSTEVKDQWPGAASRLAAFARFWCGGVLIYFGLENILHPEFSPGVPNVKPTWSWVPIPMTLAVTVGILLTAFGAAMFTRKYALRGSRSAGMLMLLLTVALYLPQLFVARGAAEQVTALNFVADTLLFAGTVLVIGSAVRVSQTWEQPVRFRLPEQSVSKSSSL